MILIQVLQLLEELVDLAVISEINSLFLDEFLTEGLAVDELPQERFGQIVELIVVNVVQGFLKKRKKVDN